MMNVRQLIERLRNYDQDSPVVIQTVPNMYLEVREVDQIIVRDYTHPTVIDTKTIYPDFTKNVRIS